MANTYPDDVALLKQELAQFLLAEIVSVQGATTFRREVGDQVAAVIDQMLEERLKPTLEKLERQAAENARQTRAVLDDALGRLKAAGGDQPALGPQLTEITSRLDELRQRVARVEDGAKTPRANGTAALAQPLNTPPRSERADARLVAPAESRSSSPRWLAWVLLLLSALTIAGLANLYYEKLQPGVPQATPAAGPSPASKPTPPVRASNEPVVRPIEQSVAPTPSPAPVTSPIVPVTVRPLPAPTPPMPAHAEATPHPASRIPADFAIERGWLAAQPFAVEPRLARHLGSSEPYPTLKSIVCGASPNCASDALTVAGSDAKQLIALQMLMSQIGDRFCAPRRSVAVTGLITAEGLADLAAIARCAGGTPSSCSETQNRVCPPDSDSLQMGSPTARSALLRWALWKTGSI